jgi:23S rRNA (uracil1939-C5)-methyltransferase
MISLKPGCIKKCPACPHRLLSKEESLAVKLDFLEKRLAGFSEVLEPVRSAKESERWHYRSKVCLGAAFAENKWEIGITRRDTLIAIHQCPVHSHSVNHNIGLLTSHMPPVGEFPLTWFMQSGAQLTLVLKQRELPDMEWLSNNLKKNLISNGVEGFWLHMHPATGKKVTGKGGWHLVFGQPHSTDNLGMMHGPSSFQQVLPALYQMAADEAASFLRPDDRHFVIDLYCGTGFTLRRWIHSKTESIGVELSGEAVTFAALNVPDAQVLRGTCAQRIPQLREAALDARRRGKEVLLYVNPPRTGLEPEVLEWIASELKPSKLAYLSCSAGTLHRDLSHLVRQGLAVERLIPFDFFPQTLHVETLALLKKVHG